ncbi:hypothetical protein PF005_g30237 [Phytophthora fragariae]|uniref:Uncharacterized protein n=1 Tax=Phytophthora fragariae TaxID=53985 RepID=A0A6A3VAE1_9STRA|nr:hypothetical protein PF003_g2621 [Phytophthora fragariae]KAE8919148.1 hypothetical protein PF009_g30539 [Phytophthora fragariae]KAE8962455.1 hypothetical protein PF011_g29388 [Phytophthora fragariae]KAE9063600.1 hypothetical protein PF007_g29497 [Phytophthora fragariae]KAE9065176.1 hypothetical protein PF010_g28310 [Phytophthora fragariae]
MVSANGITLTSKSNKSNIITSGDSPLVELRPSQIAASITICLSDSEDTATGVWKVTATFAAAKIMCLSTIPSV